MSTAARGNQLKLYENGMWYKGDFLGYEGLAEYMCSCILDKSNLPHVSYDICKFKIGGRELTGCVSEDFLKGEGFEISLYSLIKKRKNIAVDEYLEGGRVKDAVKFVVDTVIDITGILDFGRTLTKLIEFDAVVRNDDRHYRNIVFIVRDGRYTLAPLFDNGGSLLADEFEYSYDAGANSYDRVKSKPFSDVFDEQVKACEELYGPQLKLKLTKDVSEYYDVNKILRYYKPEQYNRAEEALRRGLGNL